MTHTQSPSDIITTSLEESLLEDTEDGTVVFTTITEFDRQEKETVTKEILIGVVKGNGLSTPRGQITRLREKTDDPYVKAYLNLKPSGVDKVPMEEVMPRRAQQTPPEKSLGAVRDVESFD